MSVIPADELVLAAEGVDFAYGERVIARSLNLSVGIGESVALVGPSGVGKTTVLGLMGGFLAPSAGTVTAKPGNGRPQDSVAWVLQTLNILSDRSVFDNVLIGMYADALPAGAWERRERAGRALARVGLADRVTDRIRHLSGGEVQRVVIARALASDRPFVLADEPTGQLDPETTAGVIDSLVGSLEDRGVLIVTHDEAVARSCDRVLRLQGGQVVEEG